MKRIFIYIIVLLASLLIPVERTDVGKLMPVELVLVYRDEDRIVMETDTKDLGRGATVEEAFKNLEDTTAGIIFLDTADYLLLSEDAIDLADELSEYLKPSIRVCLAGGGLDLAEVPPYLNVHTPKVKLTDMEGVSMLQKLTVRNGRMIFIEKSEK